MGRLERYLEDGSCSTRNEERSIMFNYNVKLQLEMGHWADLWYYEIEKLKEDPESGYNLLRYARSALESFPAGTTIRLNEHVFASLDCEPLKLGLTLSGPIPKGSYKFEVKVQGTAPIESAKSEPIAFEEKPVTQKSGYEFVRVHTMTDLDKELLKWHLVEPLDRLLLATDPRASLQLLQSARVILERYPLGTHALAIGGHFFDIHLTSLKPALGLCYLYHMPRRALGHHYEFTLIDRDTQQESSITVNSIPNPPKDPQPEKWTPGFKFL